MTITDVASHAQVSTTAVSKVLRNAYGVSEAMRLKVQAAIDELGYRPQAAARAMRGQTFTIGVLLPHIRNPFFADILDGLTEEISGAGYQAVIVQSGGPDLRRERAAIDALVDRQADGILMIAPVTARTQLEETAKTTPTVVLGRHERSAVYDVVLDDDEAGTELVVEHLIALGHRRIAHITDPAGGRAGPLTLPQHVRAKTYERLMTEHGLTEHIAIAATSYTEEGGYAGTRELLARTPRPTAIFAGMDQAAFGALAAVHEAGLTVPGDISVVGYDNARAAALAHISLTSVDQDGAIMGKTAGRLLLERIQGRTSAVRFSVTPTLVPRRSTAPPPAG
ncbi:LacI family DNA-binding transcriptional regulator [Nonomuraea sp. SYSU D8015]|uniref:LacI family DNA-binding transcriptional regulator n=1 Tax=Nonomuraea sp. SYSU D8015 TaxID=2593644 RepID=UPI001CB74C92|nr:LacI family DNA-binding transcriptional regulator [Nonomuraea sp. SYSU D8015]